VLTGPYGAQCELAIQSPEDSRQALARLGPSDIGLRLTLRRVDDRLVLTICELKGTEAIRIAGSPRAVPVLGKDRQSNRSVGLLDCRADLHLGSPDD
jgi:hypothetical protein